MPQFRADFIVRGDFVLPPDIPRHELERSGGFTIVLANAPLDGRGHVPNLIAEVVGTSSGFEGVIEHFREALADRLDLLSLVTRHRFHIDHCVRVVEWEPFQSKRNMWIIRQDYAFDPPKPSLAPQYLKTSARLFEKLAQMPILTRPVQCYRYGLLAEQPAEQFQYFWNALETLATATKTGETVTVICQKCQGGLVCKLCDAEQVRGVVPTEEMKAILISLSRARGEAMFKTLQKVRNHLSHGRSPFTVQEKAKISLPDAVDLMAQGAWRAIMQHMPPGPGDVVAPEGSVVPLNRVARAHITITVPPGAEHPSHEQLAGMSLSIDIKFGDPSAGL